MEFIKSNFKLDAKGLACPMPIVKTKKAMKELENGHVIEVQATDKGSKADIKAWAESTNNQYLGTIENGEVLYHYIRKSSDENAIEKRFETTTSNEELSQKLNSKEKMTVLDVREEAEYAFNHIPNAKSIPLGDLEERLSELDKDHEIYIICRTGNRSDFAAQLLAKNGFKKVFNVVPGMSQWSGETVSIG
ncbi:sulfurtransferase TusA family protein [Gottfriedia luciferensis]|uniref:sulfurtransferase TusA family protein n=1 Tax=Gottfriedia luciferensis TaxID=178774 RepID=UPI000B430A19|nr:sulfurtransferase TusA family protein [Gottfriedia luciferensis]